MNQHKIKISDIKYLIVTHFHPDHAGITQDLKNLGIRLILYECQIAFIDNINNFYKRNNQFKFTDILPEGNIVISSKESRDFLKNMGIEGEIIHTPGHSNDSISLIIDGCCAFTGDLPELSLMEAYNDPTIKNSWELIKDYKITKVYPGHGNPYTII